MIALDRIADNLVQDSAGVWRAGGVSPVSFPESSRETIHAIEEDSFWFSHRNACIVQAVRAFPPPGVIFDVGGGNGWVTKALMEAGFETVLVEPGDAGIRNAQRRGLRPLVRAALEDAGFRPRSLPAVGLFDVLEHVADDAAFLARIERLLAPGGKLYLTVPAYSWLWSHSDELAGHYRRYTVHGASRLLREAGLTVLARSYFFWFLPLPIFLARTLPSLLGLRREAGLRQDAREHRIKNGRTQRWIAALCAAELRRLRRGKSLPLGGSCLLAAQAQSPTQ